MITQDYVMSHLKSQLKKFMSGELDVKSLTESEIIYIINNSGKIDFLNNLSNSQITNKVMRTAVLSNLESLLIFPPEIIPYEIYALAIEKYGDYAFQYFNSAVNLDDLGFYLMTKYINSQKTFVLPDIFINENVLTRIVEYNKNHTSFIFPALAISNRKYEYVMQFFPKLKTKSQEMSDSLFASDKSKITRISIRFYTKEMILYIIDAKLIALYNSIYRHEKIDSEIAQKMKDNDFPLDFIPNQFLTEDECFRAIMGKKYRKPLTLLEIINNPILKKECTMKLYESGDIFVTDVPMEYRTEEMHINILQNFPYYLEIMPLESITENVIDEYIHFKFFSNKKISPRIYLSPSEFYELFSKVMPRADMIKLIPMQYRTEEVFKNIFHRPFYDEVSKLPPDELGQEFYLYVDRMHELQEKVKLLDTSIDELRNDVETQKNDAQILGVILDFILCGDSILSKENFCEQNNIELKTFERYVQYIKEKYPEVYINYRKMADLHSAEGFEYLRNSSWSVKEKLSEKKENFNIVDYFSVTRLNPSSVISFLKNSNCLSSWEEKILILISAQYNVSYRAQNAIKRKLRSVQYSSMTSLEKEDAFAFMDLNNIPISDKGFLTIIKLLKEHVISPDYFVEPKVKYVVRSDERKKIAGLCDILSYLDSINENINKLLNQIKGLEKERRKANEELSR